MPHAENQCMEMIRAKEWHTPPKKNQEILALTAEVKVLKVQYFKGEGGNWPRNLDHSKNAWKKVAPKNEEPHIKSIKSETFNWCVHHKAWCIHKPTINGASLLEYKKISRD